MTTFDAHENHVGKGENAVNSQYNRFSRIKILRFNSLPNDKMLTLTKLKAFADDKFVIALMVISVSDMEKNFVGKGENAGYQHFLHFPQCF